MTSPQDTSSEGTGTSGEAIEKERNYQKKKSSRNSDTAPSDQTDTAESDPQQQPRRTVLARIRARAGIVNNARFQNFIIVLIITNAIMMGIATFPFVKDNPEVEEAFEITDQFFLILFTIELVIQFTHHGLRLFTDGWLVFDFFIVLLSWAFQNFQIIRAFRVFRALRLITRIKILRNLVVALISVLPRMGAILLLMLLVFYIFAVMFTNLFRDLDLEYDYFTGLDTTILTLFQMMTLEWSEVAREVMSYKSWAWFPFIAFVLVSSFIVYNLVIAVICDTISYLHDSENFQAKNNEAEEEDDNNNESHETNNDLEELLQQVVVLQQAQVEIQQKLEHLALALRDMGVVKVRE